MNGRVAYSGWMVSRIMVPAHSAMTCIELLGFLLESQAAQ